MEGISAKVRVILNVMGMVIALLMVIHIETAIVLIIIIITVIAIGIVKVIVIPIVASRQVGSQGPWLGRQHSQVASPRQAKLAERKRKAPGAQLAATTMKTGVCAEPPLCQPMHVKT